MEEKEEMTAKWKGSEMEKGSGKESQKREERNVVKNKENNEERG